MIELTIKDKSVYIPKWSMSQQLANQHVVLPLISKPLSQAVAISSDEDGDEGLFVAAVLDGVLSALAQSDMSKVVPVLLQGVQYRNEHKVLKEASLEGLEKEGFELADLYTIMIRVIKENYGPLLKGGLQETLLSIL